ncbi:MAG: alpha/beta fold hydrolase [Frankia sp.]|nr:alpha/beta fold hydrolase [Frankia sp.]
MPFEAVPDVAGQGPVPAGALVMHGLTGTPHSVRAWGESLAAAGVAVSCPMLPGHGTRWQDLAEVGWQDWYDAAERAFTALRARCAAVFVMGVSMGGTLALRLAEEHGSEVAGVVAVNPPLGRLRRGSALVPYLVRLVPSVKASPLGRRYWGPRYSDIKAPGVHDIGYERLPLRAAAALDELSAITLRDLNRVVAPVLAFHSVTDHMISAQTGARLLAGLTNAPAISQTPLVDSYHAATLDNEKEYIFAETFDFVRRHSAAPAWPTRTGQRQPQPPRQPPVPNGRQQ